MMTANTKRYSYALIPFIFIFMIADLFPQTVNSDISSLADESADSVSGTARVEGKDLIHGYIKPLVTAGTAENNIDGPIDFFNAGAVLQLRFESAIAEKASFFSAVNFEANTVIKKDADEAQEIIPEPSFRIVEAWVDLYPAKWLSVKAGQQMITWGEIEGIIAPSDIVCPWNYNISTTDFEEYKTSVAALNFAFFVHPSLRFDFVWIPVFQPSDIPPAEIKRKGEALESSPEVQKPATSLANSEYAARITGAIGNNFSYGLACIYGFGDIPDTKIIYASTPGILSDATGHAPSDMDVDLIYQRVVKPAADIRLNAGDSFSIKASGALELTRDYAGEIDEFRNSTVEYLAGLETANLGFNTYFALYAGQMIVLNFTELHDRNVSYRESPAPNYNELQNSEMLEGFDQEYPYKWLLSNILQKNFMANDAFEVSIRYALSADPGFKNIDYVSNLNFTYKIGDGINSTLGFIVADKVGVVQNTLILELKYSF